ncbi:hypothetical protein F2Q70_00026828 [Brassica cretica]|uniref:Uncharacterized protein n=1 Tax=Brassica cretica TaxID=69181 RepID=A0A8S9IDE7_BRACR|nr:hypothetical protein F2Q68_00026393 [Brassica cretica]KAF2602108.1 hypothetical protein F2Q70_00026828 [Brassica cretica]
MALEENEAMDDMDLQNSSLLPLLKLDPEKMGEGASFSSFDRFSTFPCVSFEPGAQQPNGLRLIQSVLAKHEELQLGVCG